MIKTYTGPMHSGKTAAIIEIYKGIYNKSCIKSFKPEKDVRDPGYIRSNDFPDLKIPCITINRFEEMLDYIDESTKTIFIDEVQLLDGNINVLTYLSVVKDIDIYTSGLNMTSEQVPFLMMPQILAISDEVSNIPASCYDCGRPATYTYYELGEKDTVKVGDEGYVPLCNRCLTKRRGEVNTRKLLLKKEEN